jgi:hypothetical protein
MEFQQVRKFLDITEKGRELPAARQLARRDRDCENQSGSARLGELLSGRSFEYLFWSGQTLGRGEGAAAF